MDKMVQNLLKTHLNQPLTGYGEPGGPERRAGLWVGKAGARLFPEGFVCASANSGRRAEWGALLSGSMIIHCREKSYSIHGGECYLLPPNCVAKAETDTAPFIVWFEVYGDRAADFPGMCGYPRSEEPIVRTARFAQVKTALDIARCLHDRRGKYHYAAFARLWHFVADMTEIDETPCKVSEKIRWVLQANEENPAHHMTLNEMAAIAGLPAETFRKRFLSEMGKPPVRYFLERRLDRAKALLADGDIPVCRVSEQLGFSDPYYFSRLFKLHVGIAPKFYSQQENPQNI